METGVAFPSMALAAYAESLVEGRRVIVFGDATSGLSELLLERGARLVHVYDGDLTRLAEATTRSASKEISYAPLGQAGVAMRDGAFDFGIIENLAAFDDPKALLTRLRRALAARGIGLVASPNMEREGPLLPDAENVADGPSYYDLYDWVSAEFDEVKMLGQVPFVGYAIADFSAEGDTDFTLDTALVAPGSEEPDWYLALVSHFPVDNDAFTVVQLPRRGLEIVASSDSMARVEELSRRNLQLEAEVERLRKVERQKPRVASEDSQEAVRKELEKRDGLVRKLEEQLQQAEAANKDQGKRDGAVRRLEEQLQQADLSRKQAQRDASDLRASLLTRDQELAAARNELATARKELATARSDLATARSELATARSDLAAAQKELATARTDLATAQKGLAAARSELTTVQKDLPAKQKELAATQKELVTARSELVAARNKLATAEAEPEPESEDPELDGLKAEASALEAQLEERGRECRRLEGELHRVERLAAELLAELEGVKEEREAGAEPAGYQELKEQLRELQKAETRRVADLAAAQWTIQQMRANERTSRTS